MCKLFVFYVKPREIYLAMNICFDNHVTCVFALNYVDAVVVVVVVVVYVFLF